MFHDSADAFQACPRYKSRPVIDPTALQMVLYVLTGWRERREREVIACLPDRGKPAPAAAAWDPAAAPDR